MPGDGATWPRRHIGNCEGTHLGKLPFAGGGLRGLSRFGQVIRLQSVRGVHQPETGWVGRHLLRLPTGGFRMGRERV